MNCVKPHTVYPNDRPQVVSCGKCLPCLVNKRNDWSFRLMEEFKASKGAGFITLTYHPKFLPEKGLNKRHVQLFLKRLRKSIGKKIRYFCVGEYGTKLGRPHYHLLIFNYERRDENILRKSWSTRKGESFGIVHIGTVTQASVAYCTKYIIQRGASESVEKSKPFMLCSRGYGLGGAYLSERMIEWHRTNRFVHANRFGMKIRLPRYYKDKIWAAPVKKVVEISPGFKMHVHVYGHRDRERVKLKAKMDGARARTKEANWYQKKFGKDYARIMREEQDAQISRIKQKVMYTQTM